MLASFTTWGVGGAVDALVQPGTEEEAALAIRLGENAGVPCRVLGSGSNLLVSDEGVNGVLIRPGGPLGRLEVEGDEIRVGSAMGLPSLAMECARRGLAGVEFAVGIPGSVGGAVATNAGAHGAQFSDVLVETRVLRGSGVAETRRGEDLQFRYRHSRILESPELVVSATLRLPKENREVTETRTRECLKARRDQPKGRSCGSVFRNPPGDYAGRLLENAGAKGMMLGGAQVPQAHANYILAEGETSAADILHLMRTLQGRVQDETGILLEPEVIFAGFEADDPRLPKGARLLGEIA
jgi:UDP-N-acetylmuramate dehydrogenase